jgi:signal transduction histidine kinase/ActR/RegA family two-component response regulator
MSRSSQEPARLLRMILRNQQEVVLCRQRARTIAMLLGFEPTDQVRLATAVSEIARNAVEYGLGGTAEFLVDLTHGTFITVIRDEGPGIQQLDRILSGDYISRGGLGCGITGARRLMDRMEINTSSGGTLVRMEKQVSTPKARNLRPQDIARLTDELARTQPPDPITQLRNEQLDKRNQELGNLTDELAETNRGVLALYDELDSLHRLSRVISAQLDLDSLLRAIIEATAELCGAELGVFLYSPGADLRFRNAAVAGPLESLGRQFEGRNAGDLFGPGELPREVLRVDDLGAESEVMPFLSTTQLRSYLAVPVLSAEGTLMAVMAYGHRASGKFTERNERILGAAALQAAVGMENARLYTSVQNASAAKDHFLAMLSHELRTPLNPTFLLLAEMLRDPRLPAEFRADMQMVQRNLRLEARLIDDLLDMTKIVQGKIFLAPQTIDLHEIAKAAMETCSPADPDKTLMVSMDLLARDHVVTGDPTRLQQVFWNLLNNAVKFTPSGGRIVLRTSNPEGRNAIRVEVCDTGRGIEPSLLERIFQAFDQGETSGVPEFGGLGLGLAISRHIVDAHHGTINAISAGRDAGATFIVELPLAPVAARPAPQAPASASATSSLLPTARVLLVDDHPDTLSVLERVLRRRGHAVFSAADAASAIAIADRETLDLLISDIGLPDRSGLELMKELRQRHGIAGIALSGYGTEADLDRSRDAGFLGHLIKPIDVLELEELLGRVLIDKMVKPPGV